MLYYLRRLIDNVPVEMTQIHNLKKQINIFFLHDPKGFLTSSLYYLKEKLNVHSDPIKWIEILKKGFIKLIWCHTVVYRKLISSNDERNVLFCNI